MEWGDEATGGETEDNGGREVVFTDAGAELEVFVEDGAEGKGDWLNGGILGFEHFRLSDKD